MPRALQHEFPYWSDDTDDGRVTDGPLYVWPGCMRIVSARRARKLRKRGVPLLPLHAVLDRSGGQHTPGYVEPTTPNGRARYAWFEPETAPSIRELRRAANCYETWRDAEHGTRGRKHYLANRLAAQRVKHLAQKYPQPCVSYYDDLRFDAKGSLQVPTDEQIGKQVAEDIVNRLRTLELETATGHAFDALYGIPFRAPGGIDFVAPSNDERRCAACLLYPCQCNTGPDHY